MLKLKSNYDNYDYSSYWKGREYEHASEEIAIASLLAKLPKLSQMADMGGGFGRLVPCYRQSGKIGKVVLIEPSGKLLKQARQTHGDSVSYIQSDVERANKMLKPESFDLVSMVRVIHHVDDVERALVNIRRLLRDKGYLIIEFANKLHWKAVLTNMCYGNFTYPLEIDPTNQNSYYNGHCLPFFNYHPDIMCSKLEEAGFSLINKLSVSNIRAPILKKIVPSSLMLTLERCAQAPLSRINFGPSVFVLAQKV